MATALTSLLTRFTDKCNRVLAGGVVKTYEPNSLTPKVSYQDPEATIPNLPEVVLDETGRAKIYLLGDYRVQVYSNDGVLIEDNLLVEQMLVQRDFDVLAENIQQQIDQAKEDFSKTGGYITVNTFSDLQAVVPVYSNQTARVNSTGLEYRWDSTLVPPQWVPTGRDYYQDAKDYTNQLEKSVLKSIGARYGTSKNLLSYFSSQSNSSAMQAILSWNGSPISLNGFFCSLRLSVDGANYPNASNDPSVFNSPLRLQAFTNEGLILNKNLERLDNTDFWYCKDRDLSANGIIELKVYAYPASGVTISFYNGIIHNDSGFGNPEIDERNLAIGKSKKDIIDAIITSMFVADTSNKVMQKEIIEAITIQQVFTPLLTENIIKLGVACSIECNGTYPNVAEAGGVFPLRAELVNSSDVVIASYFMKRIENTKIWYINDVDVSSFNLVGGRVKLTIPVPTGSTFVTAKRIVITDQGLPQPIFDVLKASVTEDVEQTAREIAQQTAENVLASGNVGWPTTAIDALKKASSRRVDFVMLGDSNQLMDGWGFGWAFGKALQEKYGCFASSFKNVPIGQTTGADAYFNQHILASSIVDGSDTSVYSYVPAGSTAPASSTMNGIGVDGAGEYFPFNNLNPSSKLRCHYKYGTFADGSGSFQCAVRLEDFPYTILKSDTIKNTNTGSIGVVETYYDLDPGARDGQKLGFKWAMPGLADITGKFIGFWMRIEDVNKNNGVSTHTLYGIGGQSLYDFTNNLFNVKTDAMLTNFFGKLRDLQLSKDQEPIVVVYINSGANDRNEELTPSWGYRASTSPQSPTAYIDNLEALTMRIKNIWQINGWDEKELFFMIVPTHPISTPDDTKLVSYRKAAYSFSHNQNRVSFINFENLTNFSEMLANGWYRNGTEETIHLSKAGYQALAEKVVDLI